MLATTQFMTEYKHPSLRGGEKAVLQRAHPRNGVVDSVRGSQVFRRSSQRHKLLGSKGSITGSVVTDGWSTGADRAGGTNDGYHRVSSVKC